MTDTIAKIDPENSVTDGDARKQTSVSNEALAVLLEGMTTQIAELVRRVGILEQSQQNRHRQEDEGKHIEVEKTSEAKSKALDQTEDGPHNPDESAQSSDHWIGDYVDFREQVYEKTSGMLEWQSIDMEQRRKTFSVQRPFRYDMHEDGHLTFSVFRTAKLYSKLLDLCPPAHDGQVNITEDRLQIVGAFPLLHCREKLLAYKTLLDDPSCAKGMTPEQLTEHNITRKELEAMERLYSRNGHLLYAKQKYEELLREKKIDCESLKGLFQRDQLVVFRELRDEWAVARVTMVTSSDDDHTLDNEVQLELQCKAIDFDGHKFRTHLYRKNIDIFGGTRRITELPVYPLEYFHNKKELIRVSIESGKQWRNLHKRLITKKGEPQAVVQQTTGYCETFGDDADDESAGKGVVLSSRVIVDTARFPDRLLQFTEDNKDPFDNANLDDPSENNPLVLCPEKVLAHSLSDNVWYYVAMTRLADPKWDSDAWSRMVTPPKTGDNRHVAESIERIQLMAKAHKESMSWNGKTIDNFTGKGKGLIFLLHGPPGVGKTMLAECLSEHHQRPLYRINLGQLTSEYHWESKIEEIFRQARFWGAILLVDEAEVILAERTLENMHQSAWVAVFLRKIEYFEGVIFLTTNLIHMIDPAFISRVNLGFRIPHLDDDTRLQIWKKILKEHPQARSLASKNEIIEKWAKRNLNGRQIRNVIHSAALMASPPRTGQIKENHIEDSLNDVARFINMIDGEKKEVEQSHLAQWSI